jgi:hypothetical protein
MKKLLLIASIIITGCEQIQSEHTEHATDYKNLNITIYTEGDGGGNDGAECHYTTSYAIKGNIVHFKDQKGDSIISSAFTIKK